jgi:tRNA nucleotidyltransferase/poly(A) polymerase
LSTGEYFDPIGGMKDIRAKRIRFTTAAREKISAGKDPAELLRAFRFMAQLGWNFAPDTAKAIQSYSNITGGKIKIQLKAALGPANWKKLIKGKYKDKALAALEQYGFMDLAKSTFPEDFQ